MDENPYRAPAVVAEPRPASPGRPNRRLAGWCFCFSALFVFMCGTAARNATWSLGGAVAVGWTSLTSIGFGAIAWGMWTGRRPPAVAGACIVLAALAAMFTLVINVAGR